MSLAIANTLIPTAVVASNINMTPDHADNYYAVAVGPSSVTYQQYTPTGNATSDSEVSFNIFNPGRSTNVLNKSMLITAVAEVTVTLNQNLTTSSSPTLETAMNSFMNSFSFAANPIYNSLSNVKINFDGVPVSESPTSYSKFLPYMWHNEDSLKYWDSYTSSYLDNTFYFQEGTKNNVLASANDTSLDSIAPRGIHAPFSFTPPTAASLTSATTPKVFSMKYYLAEPLDISPFLGTMNIDANDTGFIYFSNLKISLTFLSNLAERCLSINPFVGATTSYNFNYTTGAISNPAYTVQGWIRGDTTGTTPPASSDFGISLSFSNIKLQGVFDTLPITSVPPPLINYDYVNYTVLTNGPFTISKAALTSAAGTTPASLLPSSNEESISSYNLSSIPNKIMIAAMVDDYTVASTPNVLLKKYFRPTQFLPITKITVLFGNSPGLLSDCSPQQLYHMSVANGLRFISAQMAGVTGSLVKSDKDLFSVPLGYPLILGVGNGFGIPLSDVTTAAGLAINTTFSYKLTVSNYLTQDLKYTVYTLYMYDGVFSIGENGPAGEITSILTRADVYNATKDYVVDANSLANPIGFTGGSSFTSKLKKFYRKAKKIAESPVTKKALNLIGDLSIPGVSQAARLAEDALGGPSGGAMVAGRLLDRQQVVGGANKMTPAMLRNRLMK